MSDYLSISDVARQLGISPALLSNWFHRGKLDESRCPMIAGRHLIARDYLPEIREMVETNPRLCGSLRAKKDAVAC